MSSPWLETLTWAPAALCLASATYNLVVGLRYFRQRRGLVALVGTVRVIAGPAEGDARVFVGTMHEDQLRATLYSCIMGSRLALAAAGIELLSAYELRDDDSEGPPPGPVGPEDDPSWNT